MRVSLFMAGYGLAALSLAAQTSPASNAARPSFEAADIHTSPRSALPVMKGPFYSGGRYELHYATMVDLIRIAYNVDADRVAGGPGWLEYDRYDVVGKVPARSTAESRRLMLQQLLADRFKLVVHNDSKPTPAYRLTATKNLKMQESSGTDTGCNFKVDQQGPPPQPPAPGSPQSVNLPVLSYSCKGTTMAAFAEALPGIPAASQYFDNKPVVDATELAGGWDFSVKFSPKINLPPGANITIHGENLPLFEALEKQLGLKLESSTVPLPVVQVDSAVEQPSPNPPEVSTILPVPTEFDVAEIRPSPPQSANQPQQPEIKNGRLIVPGITLKNLMSIAWNLPQNGDEFLINTPKWFDSDRFDLIAKAPEGIALGDLLQQNQRSISINVDVLQPMLRTLITQRFKLAMHTEERQIQGYALSAVKPKMEKADPAMRTRWFEGLAPSAGKDTGPNLGRLVTCQNMTMLQFAHLLQDIASGYVHGEVVDNTGLEGGYTFTIRFSPIGLIAGGGRGGEGPAGADSGAATPSGGISLPDAIQKQLGLKLELQKRPTSVYVIDHIEQKPVEN